MFLASLFFGAVAGAQDFFYVPLQKVYIKTARVDWKTYEFSVRTNLPEDAVLQYTWTVDGGETFYASEFQYVFSEGKHTVAVVIVDAYGNVRGDAVTIQANFWQAANPWLWWMIYLVVVALILYYWIFKMVYLTRRKKFHHEARLFLDAMFDEKGLISKVIELEVRRLKKSK